MITAVLLNDVPVGYGRPPIPEGTEVLVTSRADDTGAWWIKDPVTGSVGVAFEEEMER